MPKPDASQRARLRLHLSVTYQSLTNGLVPGLECSHGFLNEIANCSGSEDGTVRVWDAMSGQCIRVMQGYATSLYDVDWSPDGTQLVSGGTDTLVTTYTVSGETPPCVLHGHNGVVIGVGWSPDGRWLASSEWDNAIRLWNPISGVCLQVLQHPMILATISTVWHGVRTGSGWPAEPTDVACKCSRWMWTARSGSGNRFRPGSAPWHGVRTERGWLVGVTMARCMCGMPQRARCSSGWQDITA